jgi:hypothetical protein
VLYVAMTRARDHLVLSGIAGRAGARAWSSWIDPALDSPAVRPRVRRLDDAACPALPPPSPAARPGVDRARVETALRRLQAVSVPTAAPVLPLEALDALEGCDRRFQLRFVEGHREPGAGVAVPALSPRHRDARLDALRTMVAALPRSAWTAGVPDQALSAAVGRLGLTLAEAEALRLLAPVRRLGRALRPFAAEFEWSAGWAFRVRAGEAWVDGAFDLHLAGPPGEAAVRLVAGASSGSALGTAVLLQAMRERAGAGREVRAGVFAVDGEEEKVHWSASSPLEPSSVAARLAAAIALGSTLAPALERRVCEGLDCRFLRRCHPPGRGL